MNTKLLFTVLVAVLSCNLSAQIIWDEGEDGDLSDDGTNPSGIFVLTPDADNIIIANQVGTPRDVDFFTITVPEDFQLEQLFIENYNSADAVAFIAIDTGVTTDVDFNNPNAGDLLGGTTYGEASLGNDILPQMGNLGGAQGFTSPLIAGDYTIWLNQTGSISEVTINFVLGETLSIDDNELASAIRVYPNPTLDILQIVSIEAIEKIELYNILGKKVIAVYNSNTMDISNLTNGVYLSHITTP